MDDATFNMQLELQQLQAKVRFLSGGTDGEQLAEVLLDREEELRSKESQIYELGLQLQAASSSLAAFEADRVEYEVTVKFSLIPSLTVQLDNIIVFSKLIPEITK